MKRIVPLLGLSGAFIFWLAVVIFAFSNGGLLGGMAIVGLTMFFIAEVLS